MPTFFFEHVTIKDVTIITTSCQPSQLFSCCFKSVGVSLTLPLVLRGFLFTVPWRKTTTAVFQGGSEKYTIQHPCLLETLCYMVAKKMAVSFADRFNYCNYQF